MMVGSAGLLELAKALYYLTVVLPLQLATEWVRTLPRTALRQWDNFWMSNSVPWFLRKRRGFSAELYFLYEERYMKYVIYFIGLLLLYRALRVYVRAWFSWHVHRTKVSGPVRLFLRTAFREMPMPEVKPRGADHTHGVSAAHRSTGSLFAENLARTVGLEAFYVQKSAADVRNEKKGNRSYYWVKDLSVDPDNSTPGDDLEVYIDVDYYVDMPSALLRSTNSALLYTFTPGAVAAERKDYNFTFDSDNQVVYTVVGGGFYRHRIWYYGTDAVKVSGWVWRGMLPTYCTCCYLVDRRTVDEDHSMVLLTLEGRWTGINAFIASFLGAQTLRRMRVVEGVFTRLDIVTPKGMLRSTGRVLSRVAATISVVMDDAIATYARLSKQPISVQSVQSDVMSRSEAAVLAEYHRTMAPDKPDVVYMTDQGIRSYQVAGRVPEEAPAGLECFMSPLVDGAFVPDTSLANEEAMVKGRMVDVKSDVPSTQILAKLMNEFAQLVIPEPHRGAPESQDAVWEKQSRPTQRNIIEQGSDGSAPVRVAMSFQKREAYTEPKDPRAITQINPQDKVAYSKFMYPLTDFIKNIAWYAFGRTPAEIADRVQLICTGAEFWALNTDLSRFDGRVSAVIRELEKRVLLRFFSTEYHEAILELHRSQYNLPGVTTQRVKYDTGYARLSGSPETSVFNTLANAFMAYVALRSEKKNGAFLTPKQAYRHLLDGAVFGGDDGLVVDLPAEAYTVACARVGQKATVNPVMKGDLGVEFLARKYGPHVWFGDPNSCCDIKRQLSKLHTCTRRPKNVSAVEKLIEKSISYYLTDANTPVIGAFVSEVLAFTQSEIAPKTGADVSWWAQYDRTVQFPNEEADWMWDILERDLPTFNLERFKRHLMSAQCVEDLTKFPICTEAAVLTYPDVMVDGEGAPRVENVGRPKDFRTPNKKTANQRTKKSSKAIVKTPKKN